MVSCSPGDAERWRMVRDMIVNEVGGYDGSAQSLFLLQALPQEWLRPGNRLSVSDMGTTFGGRVTLAVTVAADGRSVAVDAVLSGPVVKPRQIRMRLRSGDGSPLLRATVNGKPTRALPRDTIELPVVTSGKFRVVGNF